jgi:hypothetical protein
MRRTLATLLIAIFGFAPISPALFASDVDANLPACCRSHGKHHCTMMAMRSVSSPGPAMRAGRCPLFPTNKAVAAQRITSALRTSQAAFSEVVSHPASRPQTEALYRISYSRAAQKRGPPSFLS